MDKYVVSLILLNKTKALFRIEPLDFSLQQNRLLKD